MVSQHKRYSSGGKDMGCEQMMQRMSFVLNKDYLRKAAVILNEEDRMIVKIDLHGMTKKEAFKVIHGIILLNKGNFVLNLIHGYNSGVVLKKMICEELNHERISKIWRFGYNPGETFLEIKAGF